MSHSEKVFLFTDIEGSSKLWEQSPREMSMALRRHGELLEGIISAAGGRVFKTVGDAVCAVFDRTEDAVRAAVEAQRALQSEPWPAEVPIRVRMAVHAGEVEERGNDFFGPSLNRLARIVDLAHGEQILLSERVARDHPDRTRWLELVELRGAAEPENVYQWDDPGTAREFPPLRVHRAASRPGNLPASSSAMVGRAQELNHMRTALERGRLLTLTGTGGIGKTRLALAFGEARREDYPGGVWFIELVRAAEPGSVLGSVVKALRVEADDRTPALERVVETIGTSRALIIFDNCEHVVDETAAVVVSILQHCPQLQIVATSREALLVEGERVLRLSPMPLPDEGQTWEELTQNDSVRLFVQSADSANAHIAFGREDYAAIGAVCRALEGIPLAIRLAAARLQSVAVEQMPARLESSFRLLEGPSRSTDQRHQTLRAVFQWSYGLLEPHEQAAFRKLSVFQGGWDASSASALLRLTEEEAEDILQSLTGKSLVETSGDGRFHMLETTRRYAAELLDPETEGPELRSRHVHFFAALAEESLAGFRGEQQGQWRARIGLERDNFNAALQAVEADPALLEAAFRIASIMWRWWYIDGDYEEGIAHLERLLKKADASLPLLECRLCRGAAWLYNLRGNIRASEQYAERAMAAAQASGSPAELTITHGLIGSVLTWKGDYGRALEEYQQELEGHQALDDRPNMARVLHRIGDNLNSTAKPDEAITWLVRAKSEMAEMGDRIGLAWCHHSLAESYYQLGRYSLARENVEASIAIREEHGDPRGLVHSRLLAAKLAVADNREEDASDLLNRGIALNKTVKDRSAVAHALGVMAAVEESRQPRLAVRLLAQARRVRDLLAMPMSVFGEQELSAQIGRLQGLLGPDEFNLEYTAGLALDEVDFGVR